jgi:hypothetical protein
MPSRPTCQAAYRPVSRHDSTQEQPGRCHRAQPSCDSDHRIASGCGGGAARLRAQRDFARSSEGTDALSDYPVWLPPLRRSNCADHSCPPLSVLTASSPPSAPPLTPTSKPPASTGSTGKSAPTGPPRMLTEPRSPPPTNPPPGPPAIPDNAVSWPPARPAPLAQSAEHIHGKENLGTILLVR